MSRITHEKHINLAGKAGKYSVIIIETVIQIEELLANQEALIREAQA